MENSPPSATLPSKRLSPTKVLLAKPSPATLTPARRVVLREVPAFLNAGAASPAPVKQLPDPSPIKPDCQGPSVEITAPTPPRPDTAADPEFYVGFSRQLVEEVITNAGEPAEDESADVSLSERYSLSNQSFDTASYGVTASLTDEPASAKNKTDTDSDGADFESADEQSTAAPPPVSTTQTTEPLNESFGLTSVINKLSDFSLGSPAPQPPRDVNANPLYKCFSPSELDESRFSELSTQACCGSIASDSLNLTSNFTDEPSFSALNFLASACETITKAADQPEDLPLTPAKQAPATPPCTPAKSEDAKAEPVDSAPAVDPTSPESVNSDVEFITCESDKTSSTELVLSEQLEAEFVLRSEPCDISFVSTESSHLEVTSEYSYSSNTLETAAVESPEANSTTLLKSGDCPDVVVKPDTSFAEDCVSASPVVTVTSPDNLCEVSSTEQSPEQVQIYAFDTPERYITAASDTESEVISETPEAITSVLRSLVLDPISESPEIRQKLDSTVVESPEPVVTETQQVQSPASTVETVSETVQQDTAEKSSEQVAEVQQESPETSPEKVVETVEVQQDKVEESPEKVVGVEEESTEESLVFETVDVPEVQQESAEAVEEVKVPEVQQESAETLVETAEIQIPESSEESSETVETVPESSESVENFAEQVFDVSTTTPTDQVHTLQELSKQVVEAQEYPEADQSHESLPIEETEEVEDLAESIETESVPEVTETAPVKVESTPVKVESDPVVAEPAPDPVEPVEVECVPVTTETTPVKVESDPAVAEPVPVAAEPVEQQNPSESAPQLSEEAPASSEPKVPDLKESTPEADDTDSFVVLEKPTEHAKEAPRLSELFDICHKQQQELSGDLSIEDLLAADAELICQEIHNASLRLSEDEDMAEPQEMKAPPRKSHSPRTHSSSPQRAAQQQAEAADPFRPRYKLACSPTRDGSSSLTSSGDSAVMSSRMQRESSAESGGSPKSLPSQDSGISGAEVNHSEAGPETAAAAEEQFVSSDIFKDPNAFDFLLQLGGPAPAVSRLERESLYVKFDPLVGSRERRVFLSPCLETSRGENTSVEESPAKPTQQQAEAAKDSPVPSSVGTLISIGTPTPVKQKQQAPDTPVSTKGGETGGNTPTLREVNFAQELLERQAKAFEERLAREQAQAVEREEALKAQLEQARASEAQQAVAKANSEKQFGLVMKEYEDTISKMLAELEHKSKAWNIEKARLEAERKQAQDDLVGAELSFADLHRKYERAKEAIVGLKNNEEALRKSNADFQQSLEKSNTNYLKLKAHAEAQLEKANQEIDQLLSAKEVDQAAHDANVKRLKSQITSLEQSLAVQHREKQELVSICDDLLAKFGPNKA